jgi:hypothetical protein
VSSEISHLIDKSLRPSTEGSFDKKKKGIKVCLLHQRSVVCTN